MSGTPGDGPGASTVNWVFYPWPADAVMLQARQWEASISFRQDIAGHAAAHGVRNIAFELHPLHLVFNVPTLLRMRDAVGPIIGANLDPSHLFWQQMDPLAVIAALGRAIRHVHLKDAGLQAERLALAGVLDTTSFDDAEDRAWVFRTVGRVPGVALPERAEHAPPEGFVEPHAVALHVIHDRDPAVLDVDVPDQLAVIASGGGWVRAAEPEVAGVEAQPDQRRIERLHGAGDLVRGLEIRPGVGVNDRFEALGPAQFRSPVEVVDQRREAGGREPGLRVLRDPSRERAAVGLVELIGEDRVGDGSGRRRLAHEAQLVAQPRAVLVDLLGAAEVLRQEGADEGESPRRQTLVDLRGVAQESRRSQFRPFEADVDHPVDHLVGLRHARVPHHDLVHTEGDRGAGDAHRGTGHGTSCLGFDQGVMTTFTASPDRSRSIPARVSSIGMTAVIIGARFRRPPSTSRIAAGNVKFEMYEPRIVSPFSTISIWWTGGRALPVIPNNTTRPAI